MPRGRGGAGREGDCSPPWLLQSLWPRRQDCCRLGTCQAGRHGAPPVWPPARGKLRLLSPPSCQGSALPSPLMLCVFFHLFCKCFGARQRCLAGQVPGKGQAAQPTPDKPPRAELGALDAWELPPSLCSQPQLAQQPFWPAPAQKCGCCSHGMFPGAVLSRGSHHSTLDSAVMLLGLELSRGLGAHSFPQGWIEGDSQAQTETRCQHLLLPSVKQLCQCNPKPPWHAADPLEQSPASGAGSGSEGTTLTGSSSAGRNRQEGAEGT